MQRYELEGKKFFEVGVEGATLTTRQGKTGTEGDVRAQTFTSAAAAAAALDKLVGEKLKKGYQRVGAKQARPVKPGAEARPLKPVAEPRPVKPVVEARPVKPVVEARPERAFDGPKKAARAPVARAPGASGTIAPDDLVVRELRTGGALASRIVIDGKRVLVLGSQCLASSDGKTFHRRRSPGDTYCVFEHGGAIYALGTQYAKSTDFGQSWKPIEIPGDEDLPYYKFIVSRDSSGTWWMGCDDGVILTSDNPETSWKKARFEGTGKVLDILEVDGRLFFMGYGCHVVDGRRWEKLKGVDKEHIVCRATETPSGALVAVGDGGVIYRSTDRGSTWTFVKSGVRDDLEDLAWVAGALFVVGGDGTILRTTDDGESWTKIDSNTSTHLWGIASWGDGAIIGGYGGLVMSLASPADPYWAGCTDTFAPPPPVIDPSFEPQRAAAAAERERAFTDLYAQAVAEHDRVSVKAGLSRPRDANPRLAKLVEDAGENDLMALQVYADWLQGEGDPRGELAAVQLRRDADRKNKELKAAEKELLARHADRLLGKLAAVRDLVKLRWHAGFIHAARVRNTSERDDGDKPKIPIPDVVGWLLDEPSARFLRTLSVGIVAFYENSYADVAARIGQRYLPALRELFLGDFESDETEMSWSSLGDMTPIYAACPNLTSLTLKSGEDLALGTIILPKLEKFEIITGGLDGEAAGAIGRAKWPSLRSLSIWIGSDDYGGDADVDDLRPILDGVGLPRLEHLAIKNCEITEDLIEPLATSKILPQLRSIDLSMGVMGDEGAQTMFRLQRAFRHLEKIDVSDNFIAREGKRLLEQTGLSIELGEQRDDDGDPSNRYASAAE